MKKGMTVFFVILIIVVLACSSWWIVSTWNPYKEQQQNLARELGVTISDYPYPSAFPEGYYYVVLSTDMSIHDVHMTIMGYEKVYHCNTNSEIYYYFSLDDKKALRFEIIYDEQGLFKEFRGEDDDSRTIRLDGCEQGLIIVGNDS
jgi:hypothetical protein